MAQTLNAVIFDMDGLLVDSEPIWQQARVGFAREHGQGWTHADHLAVMGRNTEGWTTYMRDRLGLAMSLAEIEAEIVSRVAAIYRREIPFLPGAVELVEFCGRRWPLALASGSPSPLIEAVTAHPSIAGRLRVVISADEVPRGKPAPDVYLEAAARLGYDPTTCLCFEDSANGILAGHAAGLFVFAVPDPRFQPPPEVLAKAYRVLDRLDAFIPLVLRGEGLFAA